VFKSSFAAVMSTSAVGSVDAAAGLQRAQHDLNGRAAAEVRYGNSVPFPKVAANRVHVRAAKRQRLATVWDWEHA